MAGQDQFESYFKRADLNGDGKISGAEAVTFSQGANLSKQVLAQIWAYADQSHTGFLGRAEFFNFLKLVTVAQSKRELTPDIVKAALYGPAASKIPPPQINVSAIPTNQTTASAPTSQMGMAIPAATQNLGFTGSTVSNPTTNQQFYPAQMARPPQSATPVSLTPSMPKTLPGISGQTLGASGGIDSLTTSGTLGQPQSGTLPQVVSGPPGQSQPLATSKGPPLQSPFVSNPGISATNTKLSNDWSTGNASTALRGSGGIAPRPVTASYLQSGSVLPPNSLSRSNVVPLSSVSKETSEPSFSNTNITSQLPSVPKSNSLDSLQNAFLLQNFGNQPSRTQSSPNLGQQNPSIASSTSSVSGISSGITKTSDNQHVAWPKMKTADIQKYTKVFMEVDTDRDGRITGEQARNLFLSWRLPREILKQVWDLSDQDSDSMLSLREFCYALYLMERFREGRPLPSSLPTDVMHDETLLSMMGQPRVAYVNPSWSSNSGSVQQSGMGAKPMPSSGLRPPTPVAQLDPGKPSNQLKSGEVSDDPFSNQLDSGAYKAAKTMSHDPISNKIGDSDNAVMDSREKIEFYRTKMQELILYKSRCDNKLNEITERASADKKEAEMLGKKYEEKYKQVTEAASKLTIEEATYRDIQARKMELNQAIINVEQGGSADGLLQVRGDRIQSDLDELMKALVDRSMKHGIEIKSASMIELPIGWQPGIPENAATWDENWDKFEDEGFSVEVSDNPIQNRKVYVDDSSASDNLPNGNGKLNHYVDNNEHAVSIHSEDDFMRSPQDSPGFRASSGSASQDFSDVFAKSTEAETEQHRFDDSSWLTMESNDEVDSIWGFNTSSNKDVNLGKQMEMFGSEDFGMRSIRTETSTQNDFLKKSVFFEDSVPGTPASRFGNSPRYSEAGDHYSSFSTFDSFPAHEEDMSPQGQQKNATFDSANTTTDVGRRQTFSFDDSDPFGSSGPFRVQREN